MPIATNSQHERAKRLIAADLMNGAAVYHRLRAPISAGSARSF
jgi:hypothetical protein